MTDVDVIVVGLGVVGLAAAGELAERGARVLGLERGEIPEPTATSAADTRVYRQSYFEHPDYVPLLRAALEGWRALERRAGPLLDLNGGLYAGRADTDLVAGSRRAAEACGLPHEYLDPAALRRRFPQFQIPDDFVGVLERHAGVLHAHRAMPALMARALEHGAELHGHEPVLDWAAEDDCVVVTTARGRYRARTVVITVGAWSRGALADPDVPVRATRQVLAWFWPKRPEVCRPDVMPIWGIDDDAGFFHYGFPLGGHRPGVKIARHMPGPAVDAETEPRRPETEEIEALREALARLVPDAAGPLLAARTCLYAMTEDGHFLVDRHPECSEVHLAAGLSGHGFKFAPVLGRILAERALDGGTDLPIGFLGRARGIG